MKSITEHMKAETTATELYEIRGELERILPDQFPENPEQCLERLEHSIGSYMKKGITLEGYYELREYLKPLPETEQRSMLRNRPSYAIELEVKYLIQEDVKGKTVFMTSKYSSSGTAHIKK